MTMTSSSSCPTPSASGATAGPAVDTDVLVVVGRDSSTSSTLRQASAARCAKRRPMLRVSSSSSSGGRSRNRATSTMWSGSSFSQPAPGHTSCRASRTSSRAERRPSVSACGTSTSHVATRARIITPSRSPPPDSLRSGTAEWASQPDRAMRASRDSRTSARRRRVSRRQSVSTSERSAEHESRVTGHRAGVEHPGGGAVIERGRLPHLHGVAHRVVEGDLAIPQRVPDRLGDLTHAILRHRGIVQEDDVEVAGGRQLRAAVPADRDECETLTRTRVVAGPHRVGEQARSSRSASARVAVLLRETASGCRTSRSARTRGLPVRTTTDSYRDAEHLRRRSCRSGG